MKVAFLTGLPHFIAYKTLMKFLDDDYFREVYILLDKKDVKKVYHLINKLPPAKATRIKILEGDVVSVDLGLSGDEYSMLLKKITHVFHLASRYFYGMAEKQAYKVNVIGTENIVEFSMNLKHIERLAFYSTAFVSGANEGIIMEDELEEPKRFNNHYEKTKFKAEKLVRKYMKDIPISIFRPSIIVGDSKSGEIGKFQGPYNLMKLFMISGAFLPMPKNGSTPINIVPVDYVVDSMYYLSINKEAAGKTFHLVDPNPLNVKQIYKIINKRLKREEKHYKFGQLSSVLFSSFFKVPYVDKLLIEQKTAFEFLYQHKIYNHINTTELLHGSGIKAPPLQTYANKLVDFFKDLEKRKVKKRSLKFNSEDA